MPWYAYLLQVLAASLLTNGLPHLVQGLSGTPFPSPFARPPGVGNSSPLVNAYWGLANLAGGVALVLRFPPHGSPSWCALSLGVLLIATHASIHFAKVRASAPPRSP